MSLFPDKQQRVIRGAMQEWENWDDHERNAAEHVSRELERSCDECWSIVVYDRDQCHSGYCYSLHYQNKWWVHGVRKEKLGWFAVRSLGGVRFLWQLVRDGDLPNDAIPKLLDTRFGFASIASIDTFQAVVENVVNDAFIGVWKVHVARLHPSSVCFCSCLWGNYWEHDGYRVWVMQGE
jgi:hypothetical protein